MVRDEEAEARNGVEQVLHEADVLHEASNDQKAKFAEDRRAFLVGVAQELKAHVIVAIDQLGTARIIFILSLNNTAAVASLDTHAIAHFDSVIPSGIYDMLTCQSSWFEGYLTLR